MSDTVTKKKYVSGGASAGSIWFLGFVGTLVYFLHFHSGTITLVLIAVVKALFWPAYITYYALHFMRI